MNIRMLKKIVLILAVAFVVPFAATARTQTITEAQDAKMKALEEQLKQQQEQNRQIMEMLKNMQGQQGAVGTAGQPVQPSPSGTVIAPPPQPATTSPPPSVAPPAEKLAPGWLACIMSTKSSDDNNNNDRSLLQLVDKQGCFIASKEFYDYKEYLKIPGMPKDPKAGWKGEAFFETRESGRHSFIINFEYTPCKGNYDCDHIGISAGLKLEGNEIFNLTKTFGPDSDACDPKERKICGSFTGGADLEPGRYKVEFWFYSANISSFNTMVKAAFSVYTKKPSDALPVPAYQSMMVRAAK